MNFRSPHLLCRKSSALLVVDIQQKLIPAIESADLVVAKTQKLINAAKVLGVPFLVSEQYPRGLGNTTEDLDISGAAIVEDKAMFSCRECDSIMGFLADNAIQTVLVCGIEAHVCVAQTAFDLMASGFNVHVAVDAIGSRNRVDREAAVSRMNLHGIATTSAEAAIFEWCETSTAAEFKQISELVK
ncbi:isochorismatase family protein [Mariniblastus fucicola]|uniref:Putative hydrolase n=1 Tax=Mariniblastus fucicola TaxID=980251 RepID=A0A5B9P882_9BACT|nr:isochorismatase family protein [Mariniblastus fucicola]QEG21719.1 putative hydrolase [Mariniblastus fucicola]